MRLDLLDEVDSRHIITERHLYILFSMGPHALVGARPILRPTGGHRAATLCVHAYQPPLCWKERGPRPRKYEKDLPILTQADTAFYQLPSSPERSVH